MNVTNLGEIIEACKNGKLKNIAKSGKAPCYVVNNNYVLVPRNVGRLLGDWRMQKVKSLKELSLKGIKNVCTVVDYKVDGEICYELQKRAKGEHFRTDGDEIKQTTLDRIKTSRKLLEKYEEILKNNSNNHEANFAAYRYMKSIKEDEQYTKTKEFSNLRFDTRKDELMWRHSLIMQMPKEHIKSFFETILQLSDLSRGYDSRGNNLLYDKEEGFSIIDLEV